MKVDQRIEAHGVKGSQRKSWRKTFRDAGTMQKWCETNDAEVFAYRNFSTGYVRTIED